MTSNEQRGHVQTVLGVVDPSDLGITLAHDHVLVDVSMMFVEPEDEKLKELAHQKINLQNRGWVGYNWTSSRDNVELTEKDIAVAELRRFTEVGGRTIVDPTNIGLGRNPDALVDIAQETGMNIIMGSGYYIGNTHPADMADRSQDSIAREIIADIQVGVGESNVRAGLIGEIGCTYPWLDNEKKSLHAATDAQLETGAALMVHPGRDPMSPVEILQEVSLAGGDLTRTIICHIDRTCLDRAWLKDMAQSGCYLEYDLFGNESSYYPPNTAVDMPSDAQRMDTILWHFENGYERQVLLSHDIATKHRLHAYGGLGYDHLVTNVAPRLQQRGLSAKDVATLIVDNPAKIYSFV